MTEGQDAQILALLILAFLGDSVLYFSLSSVFSFLPDFLTIQHLIVLFVAINGFWISCFFAWEILSSTKNFGETIHALGTFIPLLEISFVYFLFD